MSPIRQILITRVNYRKFDLCNSQLALVALLSLEENIDYYFLPAVSNHHILREKSEDTLAKSHVVTRWPPSDVRGEGGWWPHKQMQMRCKLDGGDVTLILSHHLDWKNWEEQEGGTCDAEFYWDSVNWVWTDVCIPDHRGWGEGRCEVTCDIQG